MACNQNDDLPAYLSPVSLVSSRSWSPISPGLGLPHDSSSRPVSLLISPPSPSSPARLPHLISQLISPRYRSPSSRPLFSPRSRSPSSPPQFSHTIPLCRKRDVESNWRPAWIRFDDGVEDGLDPIRRRRGSKAGRRGSKAGTAAATRKLG